MKYALLISSFFLFIAVSSRSAESSEDNETRWQASAAQIYEEGFAAHTSRQANGAVSLFQHELIENDAAGGGKSEKGPGSVKLWGQVKARKIFALTDPRTAKAEIYLFPQRVLQHSLELLVNGHAQKITGEMRRGIETVRWVALSPEWLRSGENIIELSCPAAKTEGEGWQIAISRADEYRTGGGDPANVGDTSFYSNDGGKSWSKGCGPDIGVLAEYGVRLALTRYQSSGWIETPVIDLWKVQVDDPIARQRMIQKLSITAQAQMPAGTRLVYSLRKGTSPDPHADEWEGYERIGDGAALNAVITGAKFSRRYLQVKVELTTTNPLVTPLLESIAVKAKFHETFPVPLHANLRITTWDSPVIRYSSLPWQWEDYSRPELAKIRQRENLDEVVAGARTEYELQLRLLDYAKKRWEWTQPRPGFPDWNAPAILDRINRSGGGGMCIQQNLFFIGLCQAFGMQGRLTCIDSHEVAEVWSNDFGKWVYFDAYFPNHSLCDPASGEPLSMLEVHQRFLEYFQPDRVIDWAKDIRPELEEVRKRADKPRVVSSSQATDNHAPFEYTGFLESRILRMIPRTNFIAQPDPQPLGHSAGGYFWNGYTGWYDEKTPVKPQYANYTDRARDLWPDLNTVHVTASQGPGNDRLFVEFETYTPGFDHFEVSRDRGEWRRTENRWTWLLAAGKNVLEVHSVNSAGRAGKASRLVLNRMLIPDQGWSAARTDTAQILP